MTTNPQLHYAILAMDSYHRGANGGLNGEENTVAVPDSAIDGWTLLQTTLPEQSNTIGFSAAAYQKAGQGQSDEERGLSQNRTPAHGMVSAMSNNRR